MLGYYSEMDYVAKVFYDIAMWIVILLVIARCIRRNPTDYDTNYRKRLRMIMAGICFVIAIGLIFISTKNISLPFYYLHTFGTFTPSDTMIHYGMLSNIHMYESWDKPIFALPTYEQWLVLSKIDNVCLLSAVGLIFLLYKKSSTRIIAKVRKVFGYIFLLLVVPSALDTVHFFDWTEIILVIIVLFLTWLLLKAYKKDDVVPVLPTEAMLYGENKDFSSIEPELQVEINEVAQYEELKETEQEVMQTEEYDNIEEPQKEDEYVTKYTEPNDKPETMKLSIKILIWTVAILGIASIVASFVLTKKYKIVQHKISQYNYNNTYDLWTTGDVWWMQEYKYVDKRLGTPIVNGYSLYKNYYHIEYNYSHGCDFYYYYPQYFRLLSYNKHDSVNILEMLQKEGYEHYSMIDMETGHNTIVFYDTIKVDRYIYEHKGVKKQCDYWCRKHIIEERRGKVYEYIAYVPDRSIYERKIENHYEVDDPAILFKLKTWRILSWISIVMTTLLGIVLLIIYITQIKTRGVKNKRAYRLFLIHTVGCIIEYFVFLLSLNQDWLKDTYLGMVIYIPIFIIHIVLMISTYRKIFEEDTTFYLLPQWLMNVVKSLCTTEASLRSLIVFIIYPLYYVYALPFGCVVLFYIIPAIVVYALVVLTNWIIKGNAISLNK